MRYISAVPLTILVFVFFIVWHVFFPFDFYIEGTELILTISTFLFAILAGFYISRSNDRYNTIQTTVAEEDAKFVNLYQLSLFLGKTFAKKMATLIDCYYIRAYDVPISRYAIAYKQNAGNLLAMWELVRSATKTQQNQPVFPELLDALQEIEQVRNQASTKSLERMGRGEWGVLIMLMVIILLSVQFQQGFGISSGLFNALLSTSLVLVLLIIRDLQNLIFSSGPLLEESGQEVLEIIGAGRYYSQKMIQKGFFRVPEGVRSYRLGLHEIGEPLSIKKIKQ